MTDCGIKVGYMKRPSSDNEFKVSKEFSREDVWVKLLGNGISSIDGNQPFQPEEHGFFLSSVAHEGIIMLYMYT